VNPLLDFLNLEYLFRYQRTKIDFKKLDEATKGKWNIIEKEKEDEHTLVESIRFICDYFKNKNIYERKFIISIDEYDKILINSYRYKYYEKILGIIESFFPNLFKGNTNLYFGIIIGRLNFGLKSFFSRVNNVHECTFLSDNYFSDCYGFTENELNKILSHFIYY